jgi:hypothetical protein
MSKFAWIGSKKEYAALMSYIDSELDNTNCLPPSDALFRYQDQLMQDKNELINYGILYPEYVDQEEHSVAQTESTDPHGKKD